MMDWFILAIVATMLFGIQSFLYKVGIKKNFNRFEVTFSFTLTAALFSLLILFFRHIEFSLELVFPLGLVYGIFFFLTTVSQMKALKYLPANIVFPITSSNVALVVILAMVFLKESLSYIQAIGIALAVFVIITFYTEKIKIKRKYFKLGVIIAIIAMVSSAAASFTNKIAAMNVNKELFISISYFVSAFLSLSFLKFGKKKTPFNKDAIRFGITIGIVNFLGFYILLYALSLGPLSIISPIIGLYVLVTIILGRLFYKEELGSKRLFLIFLSVLVIILLNM